MSFRQRQKSHNRQVVTNFSRTGRQEPSSHIKQTMTHFRRQTDFLPTRRLHAGYRKVNTTLEEFSRHTGVTRDASASRPHENAEPRFLRENHAFIGSSTQALKELRFITRKHSLMLETIRLLHTVGKQGKMQSKRFGIHRVSLR